MFDTAPRLRPGGLFSTKEPHFFASAMTTTHPRHTRGFSLIEVLLVLAIISIMAALVINAFSNAAQDSRNVMARQQQATLQSAINNWTSAQIGRRLSVDTDGDTTPDTLLEITVARARDMYNFETWWTATPTNKRTAVQRLQLVADYLDDDTYQHFADNSPAADTSKLSSAAMRKTGQWLELPDWAAPSAASRSPYPKVDLNP